MTELSPAAQSIFDALCVDELNGSQQLVARAYAAAAIRAVADQVLPEEPEARWYEPVRPVFNRQRLRRRLLSIAAELEGNHPGSPNSSTTPTP
jgi:hypothetical protein